MTAETMNMFVARLHGHHAHSQLLRSLPDAITFSHLS